MSSLAPDNLLAALNWRYATKLFDPERPVEAATWEALERSLVLTPSSFGLQPWHFVVVTNEETRQQLREVAWNQPQVTDCSHFLVLASPLELSEEQVDFFLERTAAMRQQAPESLTGYRDLMMGFLANFTPQELLGWAQRQAYIALGQVMASAAVLGVDACPMEGLDAAEFDRILGLKEKGLTTTVACAFGHRSAEDKYAELPKVRFELAEVLTRVE